MNAANFDLLAVVHEDFGVPEFRPFFDGEIFLDADKGFYDPKERTMFLSALLRPSFWSNMFRVRGKNISGNFQGEGRILGGVFVIGPGEKGILMEHQEKVFGDHAKLEDVMAAVNMSSNN